MKESPNWLEMPDELMENILQRLGTLKLLKSIPKVCTTWRRICKDPAMWKVIDIYGSLDHWDTLDPNDDLQTLTRQAVYLSCGELIDFTIYDFATDDLLDYIALHSKKLKRISLWSCFGITGSGLCRVFKGLSQLVELRVLFISINAEVIEVIGRNCPQLKSLELIDDYTREFIKSDDEALAIANNMPQLHHLVLCYSSMTNDGLEAILSGCLHLQSLNVSACPNLSLGGNLLKQCMEQIKDFKYTL